MTLQYTYEMAQGAHDSSIVDLSAIRNTCRMMADHIDELAGEHRRENRSLS